jgi:hypothetical protein
LDVTGGERRPVEKNNIFLITIRTLLLNVYLDVILRKKLLITGFLFLNRGVNKHILTSNKFKITMIN